MQSTRKEDGITTKETVKAEIDKVPDEYLDALLRIVRALELPRRTMVNGAMESEDVDAAEKEWHHFIEETYGSLASHPIERGGQGQFEARETIR